MPIIDIYTTKYCPYCIRAKALLDAKNVNYNEIDVATDAQLRADMTKRANGGYTVPQIFIHEQHIGGCDDLMALEARNQLDPLLV